MIYEVEFNFQEVDGRRVCMNIKTGFKTEREAQEWARENTSDGVVSWTMPIRPR